MPERVFLPLRLIFSVALLAGLGLSSCGPTQAPSGIDDPFEAQNRKTHAMNVEIDTNAIRPLSLGSNKIISKPVAQGVANFGDNLGLPNEVIDDLLQVRLENAVHNTLRFVVNTTIGIGGLMDPATAIGLPERPTDFGETLAVWGVGEGPYVELLVLGPSTQRDTVGKIVDFFLDPTRFFFPGSRKLLTPLVKGTARVAARIDERGRYSATYDSILYGSADSYAQERLLYLEHRRHNLGQTAATSDFEDPYAK